VGVGGSDTERGVQSHDIGLAILKGHWKEAIGLLLRPKPVGVESEVSLDVRKLWVEV
jgi:hypothetical protein